MKPGTRVPGFDYQLKTWQLWTLRKHLTTPCLNFLLYKMGLKIDLSHIAIVKIKLLNILRIK